MKKYLMQILCDERDFVYDERDFDSLGGVFRAAIKALANYEPWEVNAYIGKRTAGAKKINQHSDELMCLQLTDFGEINGVFVFYDRFGWVMHSKVIAKGEKEAYWYLKVQDETYV